MSRSARLSLNESQIQALVRAAREAIAADLLRESEVADVHEVLELLDTKLPAAEEAQSVGPVAGRLILREEILRVLRDAEDSGRSELSLWEVDDRLLSKPPGTSIRRVVAELTRVRLLNARNREPRLLSLTSDGRARARRAIQPDLDEHRIEEPDQLLDLIYRARRGGLNRWLQDGGEVPVDAIWHAPTVQGTAGVDAERFTRLLAALEADALVGDAAGSYRTITEAGARRAAQRYAAHKLPGAPYEPPALLPPRRRPRELLRRRQDAACPLCGRPASWLQARKGKRFDELRLVGIAEHTCAECAVRWTVYTEPTDDRGGYDPFGEATVCRARWAYRAGHWYGDQLAPPDHWEVS